MARLYALVDSASEEVHRVTGVDPRDSLTVDVYSTRVQASLGEALHLYGEVLETNSEDTQDETPRLEDRISDLVERFEACDKRIDGADPAGQKGSRQEMSSVNEPIVTRLKSSPAALAHIALLRKMPMQDKKPGEKPK